MLNQVFVSAASLTPIPPISNFKRAYPSFSNLSKLAANIECEDETELVEPFPARSSPVSSELEFPPRMTVEWIQTELVPRLQYRFLIKPDFFKRLIEEAIIRFKRDDTFNLLFFDESKKLIVVGDVHGNFDAMIESIFECHGYPGPDLFYIFNGDLVDRGPKSVECLILALALKIASPTRFFVTRGNHESTTVALGSFYSECCLNISLVEEAFDQFQEVFKFMPFGYLVNQKYFIAHGGLRPGLDLRELNRLDRSKIALSNCIDFMALLWNDPIDEVDGKTGLINEHGMASNMRGAGCESFSSLVTKDFLRRHRLTLFIRSHQYVEDGYKYSHDGKCLTIFSAPDYEGNSNDGSVLMIYYDKPPEIVRMKPTRIPMSKRQREESSWCTIESDPGIFTLLIEKLGVKGVQIEELYDLEAASLQQFSNIYGFIFLYKWEASKANEESSNTSGQLEFESNCFFARQEIANACATQAILHILLNAEEANSFKRGENLSNFLSFANELPPDMRGLCLSNSLEIRQAHNEFGNLEEYLAFGDDDEEDKQSKKNSQEPFHFVAFIGKDDEYIYELDGLKGAPFKHKDFKGSWSEQVLHIIKNRIKDNQDVRFNLMAVVEDQRAEISVRTKEIDANSDASGELKAERFKLQQQLDDQEAKWDRYRKDWDTRKREMAKASMQPKIPALSSQVQDLLKSLESKGLFKKQ